MAGIENVPLWVRLARRTLRRVRQRLRYGVVLGGTAPVFFANSFPKSGTHLLTQVLAGFSQLGPVTASGLPAITIFEGSTGRTHETETILREINRLRPGDVGFGHLHAWPEIVSALSRNGMASYFIFRDPRDVVVSHVFYVTEKEPDHAHHKFYAEELSNFDERLRVSIQGRPELDISFPNISDRFEPYLPWLDCPEVLSIRFEDFIENKEETLGKVLDHAVSRGFKYSGDRGKAVEVLASSIDPKSSPTYRSGRVGGWRENFAPEHKELFKQCASHLLVTLAYEKDQEW
ncbi:MAG: hypothetical protein E3J88_02280 [Anaerolineales bacterium]|nr:MAG: hypothetical protein E3J88_02280 [Anaerolineales bacterium]